VERGVSPEIPATPEDREPSLDSAAAQGHNANGGFGDMKSDALISANETPTEIVYQIQYELTEEHWGRGLHFQNEHAARLAIQSEQLEHPGRNWRLAKITTRTEIISP
jgi:hypothetical protein